MHSPPILKRHIDAGKTLCDMIESRRSSIKALKSLGAAFPGYDRDACMLKAVSINALYGTNIREIWRMAEHIHRTLSTYENLSGPALVDKLAKFEGKNLKSFASKYAHFFLDSEKYPIIDKYVLKAMARHLGHKSINDYSEFAEWFGQLESLYEAPFLLDQVDQYLWMAGMMQTFEESSGKDLSKEVKALFVCEEPEVKQALANMA